MTLSDRPNLRLAVLDIEASGFGKDSYPIEVGLGLITGTDAPIATWSSLIKPTSEWTTDGLWLPASQEVHGIAPSDLEAGRDVVETCRVLNQLLDRTIVVTDAPEFD